MSSRLFSAVLGLCCAVSISAAAQTQEICGKLQAVNGTSNPSPVLNVMMVKNDGRIYNFTLASQTDSLTAAQELTNLAFKENFKICHGPGPTVSIIK